MPVGSSTTDVTRLMIIDHLDEDTCWPDASRHWISVTCQKSFPQKVLTDDLITLTASGTYHYRPIVSEGDVLLFATASGNASFLLLLSLQ